MDVFLVPVSVAGYELYCEHVDDADEPVVEPPRVSFKDVLRHPSRVMVVFHRLKFRFQEMLAEAERERLHGAAAASDDGWLRRVKRRAMRWVAETIAEQRLLWNLRRADAATLHHPDDISGEAALGVMRKHLSRDFEKHRFWLAINSLLMLASGLLILVPGPNFIGYYFAFRVVGHFFSVRGARRGLARVNWAFVASPPLTDLRRMIGLDPATRLPHVEDVASRLRLDHLATFFQRTATS
jgi:Mitochondrial K+-H+ exchange-related